MRFVSYAQNYEDVMLWRALKHVECGFYIDVGANDPDVDSVTRAFYDRGWSGINIEPAIQSYEKLRIKRSRDINLQIAAGSEKGELLFYEIPDTGLSTIYKAIANKHALERNYTIYERKIFVDTLTSICQELRLGTIHFLKIDAEGSEKNVLTGTDFSIIRPWIVVVESTLPNTQIENFNDWDFLITEHNYDFVYFDGLNRYYVAHEHQELKVKFKVPINILDDFITHYQLTAEVTANKAEERACRAQERTCLAEERARQAEARAQELKSRARQAEEQSRQAESAAQEAFIKAQQAEALLSAVYTSRSWRIAAPLRWVGKGVRWFVRGSVAWLTFKQESRPRRVLRHVLIYMKSSVLKRPLLKSVVSKLSSPFPRLDAHLRSIGGLTSFEQTYLQKPMLESIENLEILSLRARRIYFDLKSAIEQRQKENC